MSEIFPKYQRVKLPCIFALDGRKIFFKELVFSKNNISISHHVHSFFETVYFVSGEGDYVLYDKEDHEKVVKRIRYSPGSLIETSPGSIHGYDAAGTYELIYWKWVLASTGKPYPDGLFFHEGENNTIGSLLQLLEYELLNFLPNSSMACNKLVELLFRQSYYLLHGNTFSHQTINSFSDTSNPDFPNEIVRFIEDNFYLPIQLDDLASQFHKSPRQIARLLLAHDPPVHFKRMLDQLRISTAKQLLLQTSNMRLKEIAARVGYKDEYHFAKVFKRIAGISPGRFRDLD